MDPDEQFGGQLAFDRLQAALHHDPPVICMNADVFIKALNEMNLIQVDLNDLLILFHIDEDMIIKSIFALVLACLPATLVAKGNPQAGKEKAKICEACHGPTGMSVDPSYPNLAGQHESYLQKSLADYRAGRRTNAIMAGFAGNLTDQDIMDLAAWFASQEGLKDLSIK